MAETGSPFIVYFTHVNNTTLARPSSSSLLGRRLRLSLNSPSELLGRKRRLKKPFTTVQSGGLILELSTLAEIVRQEEIDELNAVR